MTSAWENLNKNFSFLDLVRYIGVAALIVVFMVMFFFSDTEANRWPLRGLLFVTILLNLLWMYLTYKVKGRSEKGTKEH